MIKITDLDKYFNKGRSNEIHVIDHTSLEFPKTGLIAITGPSGCGKTTLLNVIGGLDRFSGGEIDFDGILVKKYKSLQWDLIRNKYIGYIFQNYNLLTDKTVFENVEVSLNMAGLYDKEKVEERINYVLESVGMYNYRRRNVQALSGGQQQRVAIARAIAKDPKVVLADEPTGNLDADNTFEIMSIIKKISQTCLVILVSHERELVDFYADRVIEIKDGKVLNDYENSGNKTLERVDSRKVYLLDLEKETGEEPVDLEYYYEKKPEIKPNIKIISVNNTIYVKADAKQKVKYVTDDSEIRLVNEHYRKPETIDAMQHQFDLQQFGEVEEIGHRKSFIRFQDTLKAGFKKTFGKRKFFSKLFMLGYFIISALIVYNLATFSNSFTITDEDFFDTSKEMVTVTMDDEFTMGDVNQILALPGISGVNYYQAAQNFTFYYGNFYQGDQNTSYYYYSSSTNREQVYPMRLSAYSNLVPYLGNLPTDSSEVAIDKWVADEILDNVYFTNMGGKTYEDIIGMTITPGSGTHQMEIVGIVDTGSPVAVVTDANFSVFYSNSEYLYNTYSQGSVEGYYTIVEGRDIQNDDEILISNNESLTIGSSVSGAFDRSYTIVGKYQSEVLDGKYTHPEIISTAEFEEIATEILIANYLEIADYYYSSAGYYSDMNFTTDDNEAAISSITLLGFNVFDSYEKARADYKTTIWENNANKLQTILISLIGTIIYLIFMMRSSLLGRVKEVGIYRSIGATKKDVGKIFVSEIIAFTTIASMTGYLIMSGLIAEFIKLNPLGSGDFHFPFYIFLGGIVGIYLINC
ncbi:MAG TPA: ABC transporter ATP-binding protein/permease, partial [Candidatus Izemoplasmatales bacterium]|nr:ABC transporter ATP-binding protein/permease [Candidatus Izemoplasmatales bacterium]